MEVLIYTSADITAEQIYRDLTNAGYYVRTVDVNDGESFYTS